MANQKANGSNGTGLAAGWHTKMAVTKRVELPEAGLAVEVRAISMGAFFKYGRIPQTLLNAVADSVLSGSGFQLGADTIDSTRDLLDFLDAVCEMCIVDPVVLPHGETPDAAQNEISVDWIPDNDKFALLSLLNLGVAELDSFRPGQENDVEPVATATDDGSTSESASTDQ